MFVCFCGAQGMDTTIPVTLDDIIHHTKAVKRCVLCGAGAAVGIASFVRALSLARVCVRLSLSRSLSGASRPLIVADMPFGTCEGDPYEALKNAQRMLKVRFATRRRQSSVVQQCCCHYSW